MGSSRGIEVEFVQIEYIPSPTIEGQGLWFANKRQAIATLNELS